MKFIIIPGVVSCAMVGGNAMLRRVVAAASCASVAYAPHGSISDFGPSGWRASHVTMGAEMAPVAASVGLRASERCVLRFRGVTLREAVRAARDAGECDVDDAAAPELAQRRCLVHGQMHGACLDNTKTDAYGAFWHEHDARGPRPPSRSDVA